MALAAEFLALMPLRITVEPFLAMDATTSGRGYAIRSYDAPLTFAARYEPGGWLDKDPQHKDITSKGVLILDVDDIDGNRHVINIADRITVPTEVQASGIHAYPPIIAAQPVYDDQGLHHQIVLI